MFNKAKDENTVSDTTSTQQPPAPPKRRSVGGPASILGPDLVVTGTVYSDGEIQLDGAVEGDVKAGSLTLGENASIKGEVEAELAVIHGHLVGSLRAREVRLAASSRIEGDVVHSTLSIEAGAYFEGQCRRSDNPLSDTSSAGTKPGAAAAGASSGGYYGGASSSSGSSGSGTSGASSTSDNSSGSSVTADKAL